MAERDEEQPNALVDMRDEPDEDEGESSDIGPPPHVAETPKYKYGHRITLDHDDMDKLGIDELPKVGHKVHVVAHGEVTHASDEEHQDHEGKTRRHKRVEIQLKKMHVAKASEKKPTIRDAVESGIKDASDEE